MKIETLNEFIVLADCKNFSKAAEQLFIGQSALTKHIQQLEAELGVSLINRGQGSFLTQDGTLFSNYAAKIVGLRQEFASRVTTDASLNRVALDIGAGFLSRADNDTLVRVFERFSADYPNCLVNTTSFSDLSHCRSLLRNGSISLAIVKYYSDSLPPYLGSEPEFDHFPLYAVPVVALLPKGHPLSDREHPVSDFAGESFVLSSRSSYRYNACMAICRLSGFEPLVAHTLSSIDLIVSFVEQGKGVSFCAAPAARKFNNRNIDVVHFSPTLIEKTAVLCTRHLPACSAERSLITYLSEAFDGFGRLEA